MFNNHSVDVVEIKLEPHPNADLLSVVKIGGYTVVVNTEMWKDHKLGAYIPPESVVPQNDRFKFLGDKPKHYIIKAKKIRGINSYGMLTPLPEGNWKVGDDLAATLGIVHYEPPTTTDLTSGQACSPPPIYAPKYDIPSMRKYTKKVFSEGELVWVTEKIHGCNARFTFVNGEYFCGSRNEWKVNDTEKKNVYWDIFEKDQYLKQTLEKNPGLVLYGEIAGKTQNLQYGLKENRFFLFDVMQDGVWWDAKRTYEFALDNNLNYPPVLDTNGYPFNFEELARKVEEDSWLAATAGQSQLMEGVVVKSMSERYCEVLQSRAQLKLVSARYYEKN